ncbi:MAG: aldehyde dehydrogenase family protein [Phycisphaeraceae bacterium]|nr:aldehyde dehydrogenase family protein [Phycisphaeraceae bacterium]
MAPRLDVTKTYKLYVNGAFPRSESGRSLPVLDADSAPMGHIAHASRKDLRDAVAAARKAAPKWAGQTAYLRGQILYRMGEMLEGKSEEFAQLIKRASGCSIREARQEVEASVDRLVGYAGWADKYTQVLGCNNPVAGPYYNFTVPEPTGVVVCLAPDEPSLLGLVSLIAPPLCAGCAVVAVGSGTMPIPTSILGEVAATSDVPAGALNLLTGPRAELIDHIADHRDINAVHAAGLDKATNERLRLGAAENVKRVVIRDTNDESWHDADECQSPYWIEPFVEMKTIWHPSAT